MSGSCRTEGHRYVVPDTEADTSAVSPVCTRCGRDDEDPGRDPRPLRGVPVHELEQLAAAGDEAARWELGERFAAAEELYAERAALRPWA